MNKLICEVNNLSMKNEKTNLRNEEGSALVIALFVMILLLGFVAFAITRTNSETVSASNDASETRTFEAAQASLEVMTRNFDKIFDTKINATPGDLTRVEGQIPPEFTNYEFEQRILQTQPNQQVVMTGQQYQGLNASRDEWQLDTTATEIGTGVQVELRRSFYNNRIPIFQFGIFYDDDLEFHPGPRFDFGGRVHSNASLFLKTGNTLNFSSKVTAHGEIYTDVMRNGNLTSTNGVKIKNASGNYVELKSNMGSALTSPANGAPVSPNPDMPVAYPNANWSTIEKLFQGNLLSNQRTLDLPIRLESNINNTTVDYAELIKRGKDIGDLWNNKSAGTFSNPNIVPVNNTTKDSDVTNRQRYYNGTGIRITLADKKERLPGCASGVGQTPVAGVCGIVLNGLKNGKNPTPDANGRGYEPNPMTDLYRSTRINGDRFYSSGNEIWIKVETVSYDAANNLTLTNDITEDFLSLGVTEPPVYIDGKFQVSGYGTSAIDGKNACIDNPNAKDCRSIIKLQRFVMEGSKLPENEYITSDTWNSTNYNYVLAQTSKTGENIDNGLFASFSGDNNAHKVSAVVRDKIETRKIVPFPINLFDTREGTYCDGCKNVDGSTFNPNNTSTATKDGYGSNVPWIGVMSLVDIDIKNLKRLLDGEFDGKFSGGLSSSNIPSSNGWILYVSDRRGDYDFDGEFDMEDIYGKNDCTLQPGEDTNSNGILETGGLCLGTTLDVGNATNKEEVPAYFAGKDAQSGPYSSTPWKTSWVKPQIAAVLEHKFYRRGVRLINGEKIPGKYDAVTPSNTQGFTVASENGVYVQGNYNATGIASVGSPTPASDYLPQNTPDHVPASIAADAITILSNKWDDSQSFISPFNTSGRIPEETTVRFAMLSGDAKTSLKGDPSQSPFSEPRLGGGVHNFKRFLEKWDNGGTRLNYSGSLINLYYAHNNNGTYKTGYVYGAPTRNWVFDSSFLDPNRLPPGTPFFQFIQLTGFQRVN